MKLSIFSFLCTVSLLATSSMATAIQPQLVEALVLSQRAETGTQGTPLNTTTPAKGRAPTIWASPAILQDGTLFYIAISISTFLWCTGKAVNMSMDQQERRAEYLTRR